MSEDETNIAVVKRLIQTDIEKGEYENPEDHLENIAVLYKGKIHLFLNVIAKHLLIQGTRFKSQKDLGLILRLIGFKNGMSRINNNPIRTWHMDLTAFERLL